MSRQKPRGLQNTLQVRIYPTPGQSACLTAHCAEYIETVNFLVSALDADMLGDGFSTKDFTAALPSAVKNQALRDAHSTWKRSLKLGRLPVLKKPICQWNNQNWRIMGGILTLPVCLDGKTQQIDLRCADVVVDGLPGMLRIKKKRGKWIADVTMIIPKPEPVAQEGVMGVDLGIKVPAVAYVPVFGNGRYQRMRRRRFYTQRKRMQKAGKKRAVKKLQNKEARWMRDFNHQLSRKIVNHASQQGVGTIKLESLAGIRQGTTRTSRGAKARKNNRMTNTWSFYQLTLFISYKAERRGVRVEQVDPAYTSQKCPACRARNIAADRRYVCSECGWRGHRDAVGAINISRGAGSAGDRQSATGA